MSALLLAELVDGRLARDATARALTACAPLGAVTVLVAGAGVAEAAQEAASLAGVARVLVADNTAYAHRLAEPVAALVVSLAGDHSHIVAPATTDARNILPRVAALLDVMILSEVTEVIDAETFLRPVYAGNALQRVRSKEETKVITFRTTAFEPAGGGGQAPMEEDAVEEAAAAPALSEWVEDRLAESDRPELTSARLGGPKHSWTRAKWPVGR
ncbi:MAG: hypothetical protein GYB53_04625 [Rhodobacteraceae bacterium]|nr:hypothetical protein [Paracoccaceae bacterium]MBR9821127.1 hypothetical protein [Paracoccaceae bacterium]